jgi:hypothetical protein
MKYALVIVVLVCGCGMEPSSHVVPVTMFCEGLADAYCSDEYDCMAEPGTCSGWDGYYNRCVSRYACLVEIVADDRCFGSIEGDPNACDAPLGIPPECPEVC